MRRGHERVQCTVRGGRLLRVGVSPPSATTRFRPGAPGFTICHCLPMSEDSTWRDDAISTAEDDRLGTAHVARRTARLITETHSYESSMVIGLVGPWGSGKSSIVAMCCEALTQMDDRWAIGKFTPWATSDSASMMADFYASLSGALPEDKAKALRKGLGRLARAGTSALKLLPVAGDTAADLLEQAADKLLEQPSWDEAFKQASERLRELGTPVLIVVDDVDRLQRVELINVLKVIRLLGRFPGVSYLLAYDEQTLFSNLERAELGTDTRQAARLFMEKVVQYPITVPPLLPSQILEELDTGLDEALNGLGRDVDENDGRLSSLTDVYISQLRTPRAIHRFLAQVRLTLSMHTVGEVDDVDVVILTLLRVQFPDLYAELPRWKSELTGNVSMRRYLQNRDRDVDFTPLWETVPTGPDRDDVVEVMGKLFPSTTKFGLAAGRPQSIRESDYFNRYFVHSVPADDVPDADIDAALGESSTPGAGHELMKALLTEGSSARVELAVRHLWKASRQSTSDEDPLGVLCAVMELWSQVPEGAGALINTRMRMTEWAGELVGRLPDSTHSDALEAALDRCDDPEAPLNVLWAARRGEPLSGAVREVARRRADRFLTEVLDHLRQGDEAPRNAHILFRLIFILEFGDPKTAAETIRAELDQGISVETLASRFVSVAYPVGVHPSLGRLSEFDQETFAKFAPSEAGLYEERPVAALDQADLSWPNRRAYVRGRAKSPVPALATTDADQDPGDTSPDAGGSGPKPPRQSGRVGAG